MFKPVKLFGRKKEKIPLWHYPHESFVFAGNLGIADDSLTREIK